MLGLSERVHGQLTVAILDVKCLLRELGNYRRKSCNFNGKQSAVRRILNALTGNKLLVRDVVNHQVAIEHGTQQL